MKFEFESHRRALHRDGISEGKELGHRGIRSELCDCRDGRKDGRKARTAWPQCRQRGGEAHSVLLYCPARASSESLIDKVTHTQGVPRSSSRRKTGKGISTGERKSRGGGLQSTAFLPDGVTISAAVEMLMDQQR